MKKLVISALVSSLLFGCGLYAQSDLKTVKEVNQNSVEKGNQDALASQKHLVKEAIVSLDFTTKALVNLNKNEKDKALKNIEKALGKLDLILALKNSPKFLPIDSDVRVIEYIGTKDEIKKSIDSVKDLLDKNKIQLARELLNTLQSEIDITVVSLPLATYPDALKLAVNYIHEDKIKEAKGVLSLALNTFDTKVEVIPLPLLKATELINISAHLAKNGKKDEAFKYLDSAEDELDVAQTLGYVSSSSSTYKSLHEVISHIRDEIKDKNKVEKLFEELKTKLKDFKEHIFSQNLK